MNPIQPKDMLEFSSIEAAVRQGVEPNNPPLLAKYLSMASKLANQYEARIDKRKVHLRVANSLLDTLCDTYIPMQWRRLCLDHIYQPLIRLEKLSISLREKNQLYLFKRELNALGDYFLPT